MHLPSGENATELTGPERSWDSSEANFPLSASQIVVSHENTVEVACYNLHVFLHNPQMLVVTSNICSVVVLGADDRSISVWQTKSARPIIVAEEVFERQIMDLSWSTDSLVLYAVSSYGTLAALAFDPDELESIAPLAAQRQCLSKFDFSLPPMPNSYSHS
ncbi:hypothetical protein ACEPAG_3760 [Sanghuangporus baumii]